MTSCNVGETNGRAQLTRLDVRKIRTLYALGGTSYPKLAKRFNVSTSTIFQIVKRQIWDHVN